MMALSERAKAANERNRLMRSQTCVHFTGIQNDACKAGVNYAALAGDPMFGRWTRLPCTPKDHPKIETRPCAHLRVETPEETTAREAEEAAGWEKIKAAIKVAAEWRVRPRPAKDRAEVVECPCCHGRLHLTQSSYNGHVHGQCETEGCVSWME